MTTDPIQDERLLERMTLFMFDEEDRKERERVFCQHEHMGMAQKIEDEEA